MALPSDAINGLVVGVMNDNPASRVEIEQVGEATFYGFAREQSASTANPRWLIARVTESGSVAQVLWASQKFDQIYDDRLTLFANPPFDNSNSILFGRNDSNDKIFLADDSSIGFANNSPFSVSVWFRTNNGGNQCLFAKQGGGNNPGYRCITRSGRVEFHMVGAGGGGDRIEVRSVLNTFNDDEWHHVVYVKPASLDANNVLLIVDGVNLSKTINSNTLTGSTSNTNVGQISGRNDGNTNTFDGFMDEVAVFNVALSLGESQTIYNLGSPTSLSTHPQAANLVGWWRMGDNDTFPTITNLGTAGSAINGTMTDMKASDIVGETP